MATESKNQPKESTKDWRRFFSQNNLLRGKGFLINGYVQSFASDERQASGMVMTRVTSGYSVQILNAPTSYSEDWDPSSFYCNCSTKTVKSVGEWPDKYSVYTCPHEAALLLHWEEEHGPWTFKETEEEVAARLERERIEEERRKEQERIASERSRRLEQQRREQKKTLPAQDFFPPPEDKTFFHVRLAVENRKTSLYARNRAEALLKEGTVEMEPPVLSYDDYEDGTGEKVLYAEGRVGDSVESRWVKVTISARNVKRFTCGCQGYDPFCNAPLCEHELVLLTKLREYIREHNPGDATDKAADSLFQAIGAVSVPAPEEPSQRAEKERNVVLLPRILMDGGEARLSFKAGFLGGKLLMLRSYTDFLRAVENVTTFPLSKAVTVDFGTADFTEDSIPWLRFLQRRVSETETVNEQLERKSSRSWYYQRTPTLSVGVRDTLTGATLDRFYDLAEGTECEFQNKAANFSGTIRVGHMPMRVRLTSSRITGWDGVFEGVEVTGEMPVILRGSAGSYIFNNHGLSRITREEEQFLRPFREASNQAGKIRFRVGTESLAEFYYRVVPRFLESPFVDFEDGCAAEAETLLPPEPAFTFRMDIEGQAILCDALVSYGEEEPRPLHEETNAGIYRDKSQEDRVDKALRQYFTQPNPGSSRFREELTEDSLYRLLTEGIGELERYGTVLGSEVFRRSSVRPTPQFKISVSIDSGLLDLSILSRDVDPAELLDLLESYRQKKRYHRLKSGEFVTLSGDEQMASLQELVDGLDVTADGVPDDAEDGAEGQDGTAQGAAGNEAVTEAYEALVAELEQAGGEELSWVQIPSGTGENLLAVAKASSVYFEGESTEPDIYQYTDGTVRRLTSVSSTGTAYPLAYTEEAVLFGGNHQSGKLVVHEGTGELSLLTNMNIEGRTPVLEVYAVEDGEQPLVSTEELTAEEAEAYDYYMNALADEDAAIIVFP